jgi:hypothetical protein
MTTALLATLLLMTTAPAVEFNGVRVEVTVESFDYTWTVTNLSAAPIARFAMKSHNAYDHTVPKGWEYVSEYTSYEAWTDDPDLAIEPGESAVFTARAGTNGPMLRLMPGTIGHLGRDETVAFEAWGPGPGSQSMVVLVAVALSAIAVFHGIVVTLLDRRG